MVGPEGPSGRLYFGAIFGHFEAFLDLLDPGPYSWGKMERGVKIGGSRRPKCRLDPLLGPFWVILSHLGPFWAFFDPFWSFGRGQRLQVGPDPLRLGREVKISRSRGPKCCLDPVLGPFLVILSHFGPFWAFFDPFWPFGWGQRLQGGPGPPQLGSNGAGGSKLVGPEGPSGV